LLEAYLRQVLEVGTFQADPHPGNLLVTPEGKVIVLDFGCAQALPPEVRDRYLALVGSFMTRDRARMAALFDEIGFRTRSGRPDTLHAFADALLTEMLQASLGGGVRWPTREEFAARMAGLLAACEDDPVVVLPGEFIMIARVFGTLGGLFARYRPDIDFVRHVLPVLGPVLF
jgi:ubiquinone biosynthesis protein